MRWFSANVCLRPEMEIHGGAYVALAVWILLFPIQWVAGALTAALIHEIGHMAAIWAFGGRVWKIVIGPTAARICTQPMDPQTEFWCALAGPLAGSLLLLFWRWIPRTAVCALVQTVFNLLPVYPLDGGRVLRVLRQRPRIQEKEVAKEMDSLYNKLNQDK